MSETVAGKKKSLPFPEQLFLRHYYDSCDISVYSVFFHYCQRKVIF